MTEIITLNITDNDTDNNTNKQFILIFFMGGIIIITSILNACKGCIYNNFITSSINRNELDIENYLLEHKINAIPEEECSICLEKYKDNDNIINLECNHKYHYGCINQWFCKEMTCPNCRVQID